MKEIVVDSIAVDAGKVFATWSCYKKKVGKLRPFKAVLSLSEVRDSFNNFYSNFIEGEAEDDDPDFNGYEELEAIRNLGYPGLSDMLIKHPELFIKVVKKHCLNDFLGYVFYADQSEFESKPYVIDEVDKLSISGNRLVVEGRVAEKKSMGSDSIDQA